MIRVFHERNNFSPIVNKGHSTYIINYDVIEQEDGLTCLEDIIFVENNNKDNLIKAIVEYKYSPKDVNLILCNKINNVVTPEYTKYINWVEYAKKCASIIFDAPTLENAIKAKIEEIVKYDVSSNVNGFLYNGNTYWLDKDTRVGLMNSTKILKDAGETNTTLWLDNLCVTFAIDDFISMLSALEMYALQCYNVTAQHKAAVSELTTIEAVEAYDITADYPSQLDFS